MALLLPISSAASEMERREVKSLVEQKYPNASSVIVERVVNTAYSLAKGDVFAPLDLIAIVGVESGFNPRARNKASKGVMQVNHGSYTVEANMAQGYKLLTEYHSDLRNKNATFKAYNLGLYGYKRGKKTKYLSKILKERLFYERKLRGTPPPSADSRSTGGEPGCRADPGDILNGLVGQDSAYGSC